MAPTDGEFERMAKRLERIETKVDELREEMAVRRGVDSVLRWMAGGGGIVGVLGGLVALWPRLFGGPSP